jgi:hypothetical protein
VNRPDAVAFGTVVDIVVAVAAVTTAGLAFSRSSSFASVVLKLVPTKLTAVPATPFAGLKLVIVGRPLLVVTVKTPVLVAVPFGLVTEIVPVVAAVGTVT